MRATRTLAFAMMAVEVWIIGRLTDSFGLPLAALGLASVGAIRPPRKTLRREAQILLGLGIALLLATFRNLGFFDHLTVYSFLSPSFTFMASITFLFLQAAALLTQRELSPLFILWGTGAIINAGNIMATPGEDLAYQLAALAFATGTGFLLAGTRPSAPNVRHGRVTRSTIRSATIMAATLTALYAGGFLSENRRRIDEIFRNITWEYGMLSAPGFSREGHIGSISRLRMLSSAHRIALRVFSDEQPGYLRGAAYVDYGRNGWTPPNVWRQLMPSPPPPGVPVRGAPRSFFLLRPAEAEWWSALTVWPAAEISEGIFLPLAATSVELPVNLLDRDPYDIIESGELVGGVEYTSFLPAPPAPPGPPEDRAACLVLPRNMDPRIPLLVQDICGGERTAREKIRRIADHLATRCSYRLFGGRTLGRDPVSHFLFDTRQGHCEHFASATVILLRVAGVPARYVTGFYVTDRNPVGGYWFARNRDAHAWVEAWDDEAGWLTVDTTPPDGIPQPEGIHPLAAVLDIARFRLQELVGLIRVEGLRGMAAWLLARFREAFAFAVSDRPSGIALRGILLVALFILLLRVHTRSIAVDPGVRALQRLLTLMDWRLRMCGLSRQPAETLREFSSRIRSEVRPPADAEAAAAWYEDYAAARYGGHLAAGRVERLRRALPPLSPRLTVRRGGTQGEEKR